jgi:hypothetical protein
MNLIFFIEIDIINEIRRNIILIGKTEEISKTPILKLN